MYNTIPSNSEYMCISLYWNDKAPPKKLCYFYIVTNIFLLRCFHIMCSIIIKNGTLQIVVTCLCRGPDLSELTVG